MNALSNNGVWATWEGMISPAANHDESVSKMAVVICAVKPDISFVFCPLEKTHPEPGYTWQVRPTHSLHSH